ncbi:MAG: signal recognition particle-docking protein FtsY, partial [Ectothiorhodospiraceae bacterium]|nr:signal recognition particle-docking protein FtsY [Ectothiorhodospiraceae bacterium]
MFGFIKKKFTSARDGSKDSSKDGSKDDVNDVEKGESITAPESEASESALTTSTRAKVDASELEAPTTDVLLASVEEKPLEIFSSEVEEPQAKELRPEELRPEELRPEESLSAASDLPTDTVPPTVVNEEAAAKANEEPKKEEPKKKGLFARLKAGLSRTRSGITDGLSNLVLGKKAIDDDVLDEIETLLLTSDVGVDATQEIVTDLTGRIKRKQLNDADALFAALREDMTAILAPSVKPLDINIGAAPYVILMVGINGAGKTTTIGKLAKKFQLEGKSVMLAAGDTFRAAAVEQLQEWGKRNDVSVVAQHAGADSASVIFDAIQSAKSKGIDVLIADTAGRLHTQSNLMEELKKVRRVITKLDETAPHEVMLVLDAGIGQNAVVQAEQFRDAVGVSGITLTKLDGTAKGGVIFAVAKRLGLPIRYIGVGEGIDDLRPFNADEFVDALLARD